MRLFFNKNKNDSLFSELKKNFKIKIHMCLGKKMMNLLKIK